MEKVILVFSLLLFLLSAESGEARKSKAKSKSRATPKMQKLPDVEKAELKVLLQDSSIESFISWIKTVDSTYEQKHIFLFDTKDLDLNQQGLILRVRRMQDETYDVSVKLRADELTEVPSLAKKSGKLDCEQDVLVGGIKQKNCSVTQKSKKVLPSIDSKSASHYFNKTQMQIAKFKYPEINWKNIKAFGGIISTDWDFHQNDIDITCELWTLPSKKRILECSTRALLTEIENKQTKLLSFLASKDFKIAEIGKYKTDLALSELK